MPDPKDAVTGSSSQLQHHDDWPLWTDPIEGDIHNVFKVLRHQEHQVLANSEEARLSVQIAKRSQFIFRVFTETSRYLRFILETWFGIAIMILFGGVGPFDLFTMVLYAFGGTVVLGLFLVFCLVTSNPFLTGKLNIWSTAGKKEDYIKEKHNDYPNLYRGFTNDQFDAAIKGLSGLDIRPVNPKIERVFDLDVAKLLARFCALIYEFKNEPLRESLPAEPHPGKVERQNWKEWFLRAIDFPDLMFDPVKFPDTVNLNPYEKNDYSHSHLPDVEDGGASNIRALLGVLDKSNENHLQYETVSQLGDTSSAVAGLIWKPHSNWIVAVFKGTSPVEYGEWISNLNSKLAPVGSHIHGFRRVHKGFKERVFPADSSKSRMAYGTRPYDTISLGLRTLAKHLWKDLPADRKTPINIWFTGHSLGCSTASLVYAQLLNTPENKYMQFRDVFLFAAPIVCDRESVDILNTKMFEKMKVPRTMWRITSGNDFVATCLPELGDFRDLVVSPNNAFAFAHLGTEIKLQNGSRKCQVTGNHLQYGTRVQIGSRFERKELIEQYKASLLRKNTDPGTTGPEGDELDKDEITRLYWGSKMQQIPFFIGRLMAHKTVNYVDQLNRVATGDCEWISNYN